MIGWGVKLKHTCICCIFQGMQIQLVIPDTLAVAGPACTSGTYLRGMLMHHEMENLNLTQDLFGDFQLL